MKIDLAPAAPRLSNTRLRLTFGAAFSGKPIPLVVVLPELRGPAKGRGPAIYLDPGERINAEAVDIIAAAMRDGTAAVVNCTSLADAVVAFGDLAELAGFVASTAGGAA